MSKYLNKYQNETEYEADARLRYDLGRTVSLIANDGTVHFDCNEFNPLGLPPLTIRCKFTAGHTPTYPYWTTKTQIDPVENIWDLHYEGDDWGGMFYSDTDFLLEVLGGNLVGATTTAELFKDCYNLTTVPLLDTSTVTNMEQMFQLCASLEYVQTFDTSSVTNMEFMFDNCPMLARAPMLDTSSVTNMGSMFADCSSLIEVPLYDMSSVTAADSMFVGCTSLSEVPVFDTRNVEELSAMFASCSSLKHVPLLNTSSAARTASMFYNCRAVESGALALYQQISTQATLPSYYTDMFHNCGSDTASGRAELSQIPTSWGGNKV